MHVDTRPDQGDFSREDGNRFAVDFQLGTAAENAEELVADGYSRGPIAVRLVDDLAKTAAAGEAVEIDTGAEEFVV
ncbi:hypothetical protein [Rubritalea squalenifaciens]|uniref:hypothetical protein n=1 Tax=Rubritalea squalenifaciens TaxID=407226 RepID=UPI001F413498|nr:hypothetical protein [Rubritalea squalenifaciens]